MTTEADFMTAKAVLTDLNNASLADNPAKYSWRVKPSDLGDDCVARLWYSFRWAFKKQKPAFVCRMFEKGAKNENNMTARLRRTGWEVRDYRQRLLYHPESDSYVVEDWDAPIDNPHLDDVSGSPVHIEACKAKDPWLLKQYRVKGHGGHFSGYLDGKVRHERFTDNAWWLAEYKQYNTKRFSFLTQKELKVADFKYYVQVCVYMKEHNLPMCLFIADNKNDSDIYIEIVPRDDKTADEYLARVGAIVGSVVRPARLSETPAWHACKDCDFVDICHRNGPVDINCRSCVNAIADEDGTFYCNKWKATIPNNEATFLKACPHHSPIA